MSAKNELWSLVHAERAALIDDLNSADQQVWSRPSSCPGWTVSDVVAHLIDNAHTTKIGFVVHLVRAGFDFDRANDTGVRRCAGRPPQMIEALRQVARRTTTPPAHLDSRLVAEIVHGEDIRRPLGIAREYSVEALSRALRVQAGTAVSFGGAKQHLARVRVEAVDAPVMLGAGPAVTGPALALLLALCGRRSALGELTGPGLATLAEAV